MSKRLVAMSLGEILENWRPGSHGPDWSWSDEKADLFGRDHERTMKLLEGISEKGWGLADEGAPVQLGNDGRVWNGHHRICLALVYDRGVTLMCDIVETPYQRGRRDGVRGEPMQLEEYNGNRFAKIAYHMGWMYGTKQREKEKYAEPAAA